MQLDERQLIVLDNFLPREEHLRVWRAFRDIRFAPLNSRVWNQVYRLTDGVGLTGTDYHVPAPSLRDGENDEIPGPPAIRAFCARLSDLMSSNQAPLPIRSWSGFSVQPYIYPPGAGLGWHNDTGRVAAYIYYAHPEWKSSWGGELLISDQPFVDSNRDEDTSSFAGFFDPKSIVESVCHAGGRFVFPYPNRLVMFPGGTLHCVKKVEPAAGEAFRASLSGFFFGDDEPESSV